LARKPFFQRHIWFFANKDLSGSPLKTVVESHTSRISERRRQTREIEKDRERKREKERERERQKERDGER
jgi:hypothetical protein